MVYFIHWWQQTFLHWSARGIWGENGWGFLSFVDYKVSIAAAWLLQIICSYLGKRDFGLGMKKSNDITSLVFMGPPWRRRPKLKQAMWVSEKLLKKVEQVSIHILLLMEGLEASSGLEKRHLMQLTREAKEDWKERGKMISGKWSLKQPFEWWGAERHLSQPKWKDVRVKERAGPWYSVKVNRPGS